MKIRNFNKSLFYITLLLSVCFASFYYFYYEDPEIVNILLIGIILTNLAISFIYFIIANRKTRYANEGYEILYESTGKKLDTLKEGLAKTRNMLKENSEALDRLSRDKQEFDNINTLNRFNQDSLFSIEEDLDTLLTNINRVLAEHNNASTLIENLAKNLKKHNNIISNINYNIINLNNEEEKPNSLNISFIIENMKEIRTDIEQLSKIIDSNLKDYSISIERASRINSDSLKTLEKVLDIIKPVNKDFARNYQSINDMNQKFTGSFDTINSLAVIIKDFTEQIEYFIDNFNKNN